MSTTKKIAAHYDFLSASQILNALFHPTASDPGTPVTGQGWFNTTLKRWRMNDGTTSFSMLRTDGDDIYTGVLTFNPSQSAPFAVASGKTGVVTNLNADTVDGYHAAEAVTVSTVAARDASGRLKVADPTLDAHAATKAYVDSVAQSLDRKDACRVATTAALPSYTHSSGILTATANGAFPTTDGVTVALNDRILVKDESGANEKYNGLYSLTTVGDGSNPWVLTRTTDADEDSEVTNGLTTYILEGSTNAGFGYTLITPDPITVGTTALEFAASSSSTSYTEGNGIVFDGTTIHFGKSTAYTIGDLPYASSSADISFLAAVATGKVLKSAGVDTAPEWGQVDLTADVTGILPLANGGTGSSSVATQGAVFFAGASGVLSSDSTNLFWDNTNKRLGIGDSSPSFPLDITTANLTVRFKSSLGDANLELSSVAGRDWELVSSSDGEFQIYDADATDNRFTINSAGHFGFRTTDIENLLSGYSSIQFPESSITWANSSGEMYLCSNHYLASDGQWKYRTTAAASQVTLNANGTIKLRVAASGTIDTAITWTDALTVNNNGSLAVSSTTLIDNLNADTVDGYEGSYLLALTNATGDTDDIAEGSTNLFFTNARARSALSGTASRINYNSATGVIDIDSAYLGQATITTLGTIGTGTWQGSAIKEGYGGTGITTYTTGDLLYASGANTLAKLAIGAANRFLKVVSGAPSWQTINTDDVSEGSNLYYTDARARAAISSGDSTEIGYSAGVITLGTEAVKTKEFTIGDTTNTSFALNHNLNTRNLNVTIRATASPYGEVDAVVEATTVNQCTVNFTVAPGTNEYEVTINGKNA